LLAERSGELAGAAKNRAYGTIRAALTSDL